ncbi:ABC transporter ATP-binding protein [Cohnella abietis]|uniref:ABC transporter domain-containing protein n=1 Tax=Cohnella abietis TaxID=2507935 RepID=A0A3T1DBU3_9BACL|nr:ABC transporter ATP-binding protein [Cohnella abietis]BBI35572.1 hypothetical protein KCTCHS21_49710 [Cohnella abietis]
MEDILVELQQVTIAYGSKPHDTTVVHDVGISLRKGSIHCLVGESGSGKSTLAYTTAGLLGKHAHIEAGQLSFPGGRALKLGSEAHKSWTRTKVGLVMQDPLESLHPLYRVGAQMAEAYCLADRTEKRASALQKAGALLRRMGIADSDRVLRAYPHELSGGLRQRIVIAIAIAKNPDLLICDEPTSALDVTVQRQILVLLRQIANSGKTILLITHDMGVVAQVGDSVSVMKNGSIVEEQDVYALFRSPLHAYTQKLLKATPRLDVPFWKQEDHQ